MSTTDAPAVATFAEDVRRGLTASPKFLPSQYLYDARGDHLFQQIMHMDTYYPMDCELEILQTYREALLKLFREGDRAFNLIEFGAGDGYKTRVLLEYFQQQKARFTYKPIDISGNVLEILEEDLKERLPKLDLSPLVGEYFEVLDSVAQSEDRNVILFMGGNIGNFSHQKAIDFLTAVRERMKPEDLLFVGFDQMKDPRVILSAYDDFEGITRAFNLNLLDRMNRELGAHFQRAHFQHFPHYDPVTGACRSYLISRKAQEVPIDGLHLTVRFEAWEPIYVEVSQKYTPAGIRSMVASAGLENRHHFTDRRSYYINALLQPKS